MGWTGRGCGCCGKGEERVASGEGSVATAGCCCDCCSWVGGVETVGGLRIRVEVSIGGLTTSVVS